MPARVDDFLSASLNASRVAELDMGGGRQTAIWQNRDDHICYAATKGHVFSYYLKGGEGTRRVDGQNKNGRPGAVCVFPEGHSSEWQITDPFRFFHLYVPDDALRAAFARLHDCDARRLWIAEETFADASAIAPSLTMMARAVHDQDILAADAGFAELVAALPAQSLHLSGGLSLKALHDVDEWIEANIGSEIRLSDLASLAGLSEFHFHRMFRQSRGLPPHRWVMQLRIQRAKRLLQVIPLAQVAAACGFSSQSHLTRNFKAQTGVTPGQYARLSKA